MESARQHPEIISDYLAKKQSLGHTLGPFKEEMLPNLPSLHINRFGVIPMGHNTGKPNHRPLLPAQPKVPDIVVKLGRCPKLTESAYRLIPVHPQDHPLQAMKRHNRIYVDPMLPFGLRSAPKIFNAVTDALNWCLCHAGIQYRVSTTGKILVCLLLFRLLPFCLLNIFTFVRFRLQHCY